MRPHRATGNPRGRPAHIPADLGLQILAKWRERVDPATGLVKPDWKGLARELHVSRSTISRRVALLHAERAIESVNVPVTEKTAYTYYRILQP